MSVWSRIVALAAHAFQPEAHEPPSVDMLCAPDPNDVGFTAAVVGLAAKMARADGSVTATEATAAARVFRPPPGEEQAFRRAFDIARQTVLGYESYARQIGKKYRARPCLLEDVLDGLFHIAAADGVVHQEELDYLARVAELFGFSESEFRRIKASNLGIADDDPYAVLGLLPGASWSDIQRAWRRLAAEHHPDRLLARGAPPEFVAVAQNKMATINDAYAQLREEFSEPATAG
jgi:DnaJ like chaperone protein